MKKGGRPRFHYSWGKAYCTLEVLDVSNPIVSWSTPRRWADSTTLLVTDKTTIVDALHIFGEERRCLHDLIARTIVVENRPYVDDVSVEG